MTIRLANHVPVPLIHIKKVTTPYVDLSLSHKLSFLKIRDRWWLTSDGEKDEKEIVYYQVFSYYNSLTENSLTSHLSSTPYEEQKIKQNFIKYFGPFDFIVV